MGIFTMTRRTITTAPLGLLLLAGFCLGQHFGYGDDDGPSTWGDHFPTCSGKHQSPINIEERDAKSKKFPLLKISGPNKLHVMTVVNNGHTIMLKSNESTDDLPIVSGGPLRNDIYKFEQLHFHWGKDDSEGSETTINNKSYPMEMHAVFYKKDYESLDNAVNYSDGLTVLGYMYEIGLTKNKIFDPIVQALLEVQKPDGEEAKILLNLPGLLKPDDTCLLHLDKTRYYTYNGSLTTPPCSEVVTWIVFKKPKSLSDIQLACFRNVKTDDGKLTHNFRPVQPLGDRVVYRNIPNGQCKKLPWLLQSIVGLFLFAV